MSASNKVVRFWNNVRTQTAEPYVFEDDDAPAVEDHDMERLAKGVEIATSNVVHCEAKLTTAQVAEVRRRLADGEVQRLIAASLGVSQSLISAIKLGRIWS